MQKTQQLGAKPHYPILDGLRGVAAVVVVAFHLLEAHSTSHYDQMINHGYLAVDFFFLLSGFVIGYAYDDRWGRMSVGEFFKRRLIRLQPMIIPGMIIGAALFYFQDSTTLWPGIHSVPVWKTLLIMIIGMTLLPIPKSMDIRGWDEMHPLNGPAWSLFFEYIANILYALFVRRFSKTMLSILVFLSAAALIHMAVRNGDMIGGWALDGVQLKVGFTRLMFPFFGGLLLSRVAKPGKVKNAFIWCSLLVIAVLSAPRIGGESNHWMNGLYDASAVILVFPLIVWLGASGGVGTKGPMATACRFLGDISYPLYITHFPIICTYFAWVRDGSLPISQTWPVALGCLVGAIVIAYVLLKFYDEPVRRWLSRKFSKTKT